MQVLQNAGLTRCRPRTMADDQDLEERVNEWSQGGALGEDEQGAQDEQSNDNRQEPPLLRSAEEIPKLFDNGQLHCSVRPPTPDGPLSTVPRMHRIRGDVKFRLQYCRSYSAGVLGAGRLRGIQ